MKSLFQSTIAMLSFFVASCATYEPGQPYVLEPDYVSVEVALDDNDLSFWDISLLESAVVDTAPVDRDDGLVVGRIGPDGGDKDMIVALSQEIAAGQHGNYDSLLIIHEGKLLFESYYMRGRINATHPQVSATKAYTALVLGRAIELGYLTMADLDQPVASFLDNLDPTKFVDGVDRVTLHQALTMRGGLSISEEQQEAFDKDPSLLQGQGQVQALFEKSAPITDESQEFIYGNYNPGLVMQVIDAVVPGSAADFIKYELLDKLGIVTYGWQTDVSGLPAAGWRSSITSRAMAKIGLLVMQDGKWDGEQLIPRAFIAKALSGIVSTGDEDIFGGGKDISNQGYGYFWWNSDMQYGGRSYFNASAQGGGGQFIILVDALDLMIVVTAHDPNPNALQLTAERILPAFVD